MRASYSFNTEPTRSSRPTAQDIRSRRQVLRWLEARHAAVSGSSTTPGAQDSETVYGASEEIWSGAGETGDPRENPPTDSIDRHDPHLRKYGDPAGDRTRFALVGGGRADRSVTVDLLLKIYLYTPWVFLRLTQSEHC
ncbi:hypothetical protein PR048_032353 [Dryococelus australis]|uniref:Uncharacterized protein n=1 Tax=Dryococelus australis TaxID=614101 RepID=A0ABQ9G211_9NEOP|nr:hypothetical protein PR048_032353 [Dryococelus australis]